MSQIAGAVATSFGFRAIDQNINAGKNLAYSQANSTIDTVDKILGNFELTGDAALDAALEALSSLSNFKPGEIAFSYDIPDYQTTAYKLPEQFVPFDISSVLSEVPPSDGVNMSIDTTKLPSSISAPRPDAYTLDQIPDLVINFPTAKPRAPTQTPLNIPGAPSLTEPTFVAVHKPIAPNLRDAEYVDAQIEYEFLPFENTDYEFLVGQELAAAQSALSEIRSYAEDVFFSELDQRFGSADADATPYFFFLDEEARQDGSFTSYNRASTYERLRDIDGINYEDFVRVDIEDAGERWRRFGHDFGRTFNHNLARAHNDAHAVSVALANGQTAVTHNEFQTSLDIDEFEAGTTIELDLILAKAETDIKIKTVALAETKLAIYKSLDQTARLVYRAKLAEYEYFMKEYEVYVSRIMLDLETWKQRVKNELSKAAVSEDLAKRFGVSVDAETLSTALYAAQVQQVRAQIRKFAAQTRAFRANADIAKTQLSKFNADVEAYSADLSSVRAEYDKYIARARTTQSFNQLKQTESNLNIADMRAAGAQASFAADRIQTDATQLRLQADQLSASLSSKRLRNTLEALKTDIAESKARIDIRTKSTQFALSAAQNQAISDQARLASKYFTQASDASFRASEQAFRAVIGSSQAANIAQDSSSRAAAALAQGAYSAISVSASIQSSGRVSAGESMNTSNNRQINDTMNYTESRQQILSA